MSVELTSTVIPPITAGAIIGIILYMKKERERCITRIEKQLDRIMEFIQVREKLDRELEGRLSKLEGRTIERDNHRNRDSLAHNSRSKELHDDE